MNELSENYKNAARKLLHPRLYPVVVPTKMMKSEGEAKEAFDRLSREEVLFLVFRLEQRIDDLEQQLTAAVAELEEKG